MPILAMGRHRVLKDEPQVAIGFCLFQYRLRRSLMCPLISLDKLAKVDPPQVGETAYWLSQLQQSGQATPTSWVVPATVFHQALQDLVARDPLYADWPQLLWQHASTTGYAIQHLAKRLQRPLANLPLNLNWSPLIDALDAPVVRLLPSLWYGEAIATLPWSQMLAQPYCWREPEALEAALKRVWLSAFEAKSLAFWSRWRATQFPQAAHYPAQVEFAVVVQAVEAAAFSGTLTLREPAPAIAVVEGLPMALAESCPATFTGELPRLPHFSWQPGFQAQFYTLRQFADIAATPLMEPCLQVESRSVLELLVPNALEQQLWALVKQFTLATGQALQAEWSLNAETSTLQVRQLHQWPLQPFAPQAIAPLRSETNQIAGRGAAPGQGQGRALILSPQQTLPMSARQHIVIAAEVLPEWLPLLKTASGIISEQGGLTCHAAVLARELGIPAIIGIERATQRFREGEALAVDGDRGLITALPELIEQAAPQTQPQIAWESTRTEIWVNLSQPESAAAVATLPVKGVGLLRSEWLMLPVLDRQHPYHWIAAGQKEILVTRLMQQLRPILAAFAPRPVRYRTLDIRTSEFAQLTGAPPVEPNPMLGQRGTFSYRHQAAFFELELEVLKRLQDEGHGNLQLLLPFVRTVEEVVDCRRQIEKLKLHYHPDFALWMMAEVPSVLFLLPQYGAAGIQGIAIGTHDLTQLMLGIDRDQAVFSAPYDETHPAVQGAIAQLIRSAHQAHLLCCLCGASPAHHPDFVAAAVHEHVTGLSVDVSALEVTLQIVQQAEGSLP